MTRSVQIREILATAELPSDASFFDLYDGDTLVAHAQRPRVYSKAGWRVTLYRPDRTAYQIRETFLVMGAVKMHMQKLRRGQI